MRRLTWLALLMVLAVGLLPTASPAALDIAVGMTASDVSLGEALLAAGVASFLGFDTHVVVYYHDALRLPLSSVLTVLLFSRMFDADHHRVAAWRQHGLGWGRIAQDLGVHPGAFNKLRKGLDVNRVGDADFERLVTIWYLSRHYGVPEYRFDGWQRTGHPLLSVLIALDLGAKSHRSVSDLFSSRQRLPSWHAVADAVKVGHVARRRPEKPKGGQEFRHAAFTGRPKQAGGGSASSGGSAGSGGQSGDHGNRGSGHGNQGRGHGKGPKH